MRESFIMDGQIIKHFRSTLSAAHAIQSQNMTKNLKNIVLRYRMYTICVTNNKIIYIIDLSFYKV